MSWEIRQGDVMDRLREMPEGSVQMVCTSPPFWGLRDYGVVGQLGLERTPEEYVAKMVEVFREVRRVLRKDGTLWLNLGSSYATGAGSVGECPGGGEQGERWKGYRGTRGESPKHAGGAIGPMTQPNRMPLPGYKPKDMVPIPWLVALALQADGWYLRSDIIWSKPNPMPESVTDRPTKAHEYVFLLTKSARYYFDAEAVREPHTRDWSGDEGLLGSGRTRWAEQAGRNDTNRTAPPQLNPSGRNIRSVWAIATQPFPEAHFATFPEKLVEPCIKAGTSEKGCCAECGAGWERTTDTTRSFESGSGRAGNLPSGKNGPLLQGGGETVDIRRGPTLRVKTTGWTPVCNHGAPAVPCLVLDPFAGSGTVGVVALRLGRSFVGIELKREYAEMARRRIVKDAALLNSVSSSPPRPLPPSPPTGDTARDHEPELFEPSDSARAGAGGILP